jgi:hypothetical protein
MEACEVVRLFVNKAIVSAEKVRRGNPGYGRIRALRVLVYARLKGIKNDTRIVEHLKKHAEVSRTLGLHTAPDRTTVGRWWKRYLSLLEETFKKIANMLQLGTPNTLVVVDSTPLVDLYDMEAGWGHTSRGKFRGFKLHAAVNQLGLPLRALVTPGNRYDGPFLPKLIEDLEAEYVLADAAYYSKKNALAVAAIDAEPVIACNPRRGKRRKVKHSRLLKSERYVIEQFNGHVKDNVLDGCWIRPRGIAKKTAMVMAGLVCIDANAIRAMIEGETSLKSVSQYWD